MIEVAGLPRAGKTTLVKAIFSEDWTIHPEVFDLCPIPRSQHDEYNMWYARHVQKVVSENHHKAKQLIERGPFDRIAFARALHQWGSVSKRALTFHEELLHPEIEKMKQVIICDINVDLSLKRDTPSKSFTGNRTFLTLLRIQYLQLARQIPHSTVLDTTEINEHILDRVQKITEANS